MSDMWDPRPRRQGEPPVTADEPQRADPDDADRAAADDPSPPEPVVAAAEDDGGMSVLVELAGGAGMSAVGATIAARGLGAGFVLDEEYGAVELDAGRTYIVRGSVGSDRDVRALEARPDVVRVWRDTPIAPFGEP